MKKLFTILLVFISVLTTGNLCAQDLQNPGEYMTSINNAQTEMNQKYMAYMSAAAHSSRKRKIEKLRQQTLESIDNSRFKTINLPIYKGDNSFRQSSIDYIKLIYSVFNEDYARIVNMEEIAEQSFDEMQAFILLQEKTDEKIKEAADKMSAASKAFAKKYNVTLVESNDDLGDKLGETGKLNDYRNNIYLIFFKCNWQDGEIAKALKAGKITQIEQGRSSLIRYANEGLLGLDSLSKYKGDGSLANACRQLLQYYKKKGEVELPKLTEFFLKKENMEKMQKAFERKSEPTKEDVKSYNASIDDFNKSTNAYNATNASLYASLKSLLDNWNEAEKNFLDTHTPHYKK